MLFAAFVRLWPLSQYLYWGADFGEYFSLTRLLAEGAIVPTEYGGWGVTYPEFPGMQVLVAAVAWTGIPLEASAVLVVPVLASLVVFPAYLIGRELTGRDEPALLAAAIVGVAMPHVYPTSHPIPGALGDLLLVSGLLLVLRLRDDRRMWGLLIPLSLALMVVHHLSSYFLIIATFTAAFLRVMLRRASFAEVGREAKFLAFLVVANVAYWGAYTENFRDFLGAERVPWWLTVIFALLLPVSLYPIAVLRRRISWSYSPTFPLPLRGWRIFALSALLAYVLLAVFYFVAVPGTAILVSGLSILLATPYLGLFLLSAPGRKYLDFMPGGTSVTGWFLAFNVSWMVGGLVAPTFLIPYRHLEYLTLPLAIFGGIGALQLAGVARRWRKAIAISIVALVAISGFTALPPREALGNHFEGTRPQVLNVVYWASDMVGGVTATDHRVSTILFGLGGVRATWDKVSLPLHALTFDEARVEMEWVEDLPGGSARIDYVLLDQDLIAGAMLFPWDPALPLSQGAQDKFLGEHYLKLYDDGYSQLYWINWGYG